VGRDVFVSYSRKDREFVLKLHEELSARGKDVYVDWEDIPVWSPDWQANLYAAIEAADTFVIVLTPDSLASPNVKRELDHALEQQKRIKPLLLRLLGDDGLVPEPLRRPQWIGSGMPRPGRN
jgi:TIR domain